MIRPARFSANPETASTNAFQSCDPPGDVAAAGRKQFDALAAALRGEGLSVFIAEDTADPPKPDALFANNWLSFHADGTVVLYPMQAPNRRAERRRELIDALAQRFGVRISRILDLTAHERSGRYLEGTGSLVLDHRDHVAYACRSARTDVDVLAEWSAALGYESIVFQAADPAGLPLYHTNVLMSIGERAALVGMEAIAEADRTAVKERLAASAREVIELSWHEIAHFAGNVLEVATVDEALGDCHILVMSETARHALRPDTFARIAGCTDEILVVPVPTIERFGGGSVRCMITEVFLPT